MTTQTLLIVAHTPSVNTQALADAVYQGACEQAQIDFADAKSQLNTELNVQIKTPQQTDANDVLAADAIILGTTENLAYMSGLTKDFFDRCYYPLLEQKRGMPYAIYIRAGHDGTATCNALASINNGLRWNLIAEPLVLKGTWDDAFITEVKELAMAMVAGMAMGIF